jgi:hypothetical protein
MTAAATHVPPPTKIFDGELLGTTRVSCGVVRSAHMAACAT